MAMAPTPAAAPTPFPKQAIATPAPTPFPKQAVGTPALSPAAAPTFFAGSVPPVDYYAPSPSLIFVSLAGNTRLSPGVIAAIVVSSFLFLALVSFSLLVYYSRTRRRSLLQPFKSLFANLWTKRISFLQPFKSLLATLVPTRPHSPAPPNTPPILNRPPHRPSPRSHEDIPSHVGPHLFSVQELTSATQGFHDTMLLGKGGFGRVYKGILPQNNQEVAVKSISDDMEDHGYKGFIAEVTIISNLRHQNLITLQGWGHGLGQLFIVYDYMPCGSLDTFLYNDDKCVALSWRRRFKIMSGLAYGLLYLHEDCGHTTLHRDIKSSNVLLDNNFTTKLGDFGLSRHVCNSRPTPL
ncbi:hypothetical protein L7F22_043025 [Adiantum nelumboides]|nr:hypothetical protein [Adiantum nelumboides]